MAQKVKYETTTVSADRSAQEIETIIRKYRATSFQKQFDPDTGDITAVRFTFQLGDRELPIILRAATDRIYEILTPKTEGQRWQSPELLEKKRERRQQQAKRIAWRHLRDLIEQLLLSAELGIKSIWHVFMADIEVYDAEAEEEITLGEMFERREAAGFLPPTRKMLNP